jgi:lactoylglutathione lyase
VSQTAAAAPKTPAAHPKTLSQERPGDRSLGALLAADCLDPNAVYTICLTFRAACCAASAPRNGSAFRLPPVALIHTCYRITDIDRSVAFYEALGFKEVGRIPIREEAVNVFMNQPGDGDMPRLELTYNFGVESYDLGSGYGHIALSVEDLDATLARLAEQGIDPEKPPYSVREGGSRLCFVRDPDGYRVEILEKP